MNLLDAVAWALAITAGACAAILILMFVIGVVVETVSELQSRRKK